ncbi:enoyl-CoA hydratase/isomerase family protein [Ilyobacter sp.]|uniref:enoyl-CoA hydratase/isomerase family protein n=1 Tax=Ilyobacter sp. TaxID=3100343 RepID=UPI00356A1172
MTFVTLKKQDGVGILTISRGNVNPINEKFVDELTVAFKTIEKDKEINSVILTGYGKFFSFGFDIPEFLSYSKENFSGYVKKFTELYTLIFTFSKPVIASLNGHTMAGGCMLAMACDYRIMASGKSKISLNELTFGATVLAGSVEMLRFIVGNANSSKILYSGKMYSSQEAKEMGLIDEVAELEDLTSISLEKAKDLGDRSSEAFHSIKKLIRKPVAEEMKKREIESIKEFVEIWYSSSTQENLKKITIN